ncbi:hypothetical protein KDW99_06165 [Marinomonas rhizomae]|uniref:hypothetical protein n=1 Tax=Marinomonas rhizomae TaxID=491948 RepID=UPI002102524C|nr:hypothetical protein [Marinomonas rhizomae]UTW00710.1 hypothetical protein KDW99_06165 [Marinomonas rhizomae]
MKLAIAAMLSGVLLLISQIFQAYSGQNHTYWASDLIHVLAVLAVSGIVVGGFVYKRLLRRRKQLERERVSHDA